MPWKLLAKWLGGRETSRARFQFLPCAAAFCQVLPFLRVSGVAALPRTAMLFRLVPPDSSRCHSK